MTKTLEAGKSSIKKFNSDRGARLRAREARNQKSLEAALSVTASLADRPIPVSLEAYIQTWKDIYGRAPTEVQIERARRTGRIQ